LRVPWLFAVGVSAMVMVSMAVLPEPSRRMIVSAVDVAVPSASAYALVTA
jgi:hypothetical protein